MGDGPNSAGKWSKYSVGEDGKLERKAEFCHTRVVAQEYSQQFTRTAYLVVAAATPK